ncbi:MAG: YbbR-like domain-containing protein [Chloroflexota bacterium]
MGERDQQPRRRFRLPPDVLPRAGVSVLIALLIWGWVTTQSDPTQTRDFASLPIQAPQLPEPLQIAGEPGTVNLRVKGPRSAVEDLSRSEIEPRLDLSGVSAPGSYTVPVAIDLPGPLRAEYVDPPRLSIVVDETASRTMPLDVVAEPPTDGTRRLGAITPEYSEVTVSGPRRLVDQVARVVLPIEIGDRTSNFTGQFNAIALDADRQPIPEVDLRPRRIIVDVEVEARGRSVPVLVQTFGSPAPGFETVDRVVNPSTVLLDGPDEALADLVSVVTEPISIEGATAPVSARVGLAALPPEVRLVDPADGQVTVVVQVRQRGVTQTLPDQPVVVTDLGDGLSASVEPASIAVVIFAAEDQLTAMRAGEVQVSSSVAGLSPGSYELPLSVAVPPGVQWIRTEPEVVTVTITRGGTPQPGRQIP